MKRTDEHDVIPFLLNADPAIRWQVLRDLTDASADEVAAERARVSVDGLGAQLLALQGADGTWGGAAWNHGWDSTMHALMLLREFGLDPDSDQARTAIDLVRERVTWNGCGPEECNDNAFFAGEIEPCINGQVALVGAYFGQDVRVIVGRLLNEQLSDGGWNCEAERGSTRASFNTTICVLEALLQHEQRFGADSQIASARARGHEYLLERRLFRRKSTGGVIAADKKGRTAHGDAPAFTQLAFPTWWHYDVLRALDYFRDAGVAHDPRMDEAVRVVGAKRSSDGRWSAEIQFPGVMPIEIDDELGRPSRWITHRALRVLKHYSSDASAIS